VCPELEDQWCYTTNIRLETNSRLVPRRLSLFTGVVRYIVIYEEACNTSLELDLANYGCLLFSFFRLPSLTSSGNSVWILDELRENYERFSNDQVSRY
jgi:hypothetical protein